MERGQTSALFRDLVPSSSKRATIRCQTNLLMRDCSQPSALNIHSFLAKYIIENQLDIIASLNKISLSLMTKEIFSLSLRNVSSNVRTESVRLLEYDFSHKL